MAFEEYDDYEQSERVQQWLRQNGVSILVGIVLGLVLIFGWQAWKSHRANHRAAASAQFAALQNAIDQGKDSEADAIVATLEKDYGDSTYAVFAAAMLARQEAGNNHLDKAAAALQWAVSHADSVAVKGLMQLRLARVQLAQGKANDALTTLQTVPRGDYTGLAAELRGDALVKLGRADAARQAYQAALAALGEGVPQRGIVKMKIDNLAKAGKQGA